jgi:hypothetical protein
MDARHTFFEAASVVLVAVLCCSGSMSGLSQEERTHARFVNLRGGKASDGSEAGVGKLRRPPNHDALSSLNIR